jgi:hypothetical protein
VVRAGENRGSRREGLPKFGVTVDLYFAVSAGLSDTLSGVVSAVEALRVLADDAIVGGTTYRKPAIRRAGRVSVVHYELSCAGIGCEAYIQWLRNESDIPVLNESGLVIFV